jgi:hypothetical protein
MKRYSLIEVKLNLSKSLKQKSLITFFKIEQKVIRGG